MIPDWSKKTIAVAEDDIYSVMLLQKMLKDTQINILAVTSGQKIIDLVASNNQIDLVFMDIELPFISGLKAAAIIRKTNLLLPIVMVTAYYAEHITKECVDARANQLIVKPFTKEIIFSALTHYLG